MSPSGRPPYPHVHQINVSDGGVPKHPVFEAKISKEGVEGDRQKNLKVHGGPDRAVCLFSVDLIERMQDEGHSIDAGSSRRESDARRIVVGDARAGHTA